MGCETDECHCPEFRMGRGRE